MRLSKMARREKRCAGARGSERRVFSWYEAQKKRGGLLLEKKSLQKMHGETDFEVLS